MTPERVKALLFEIGAKLDRAATFAEFSKLSAQYRALKTKWNELTNNAILSNDLTAEIVENGGNAVTLS